MAITIAEYTFSGPSKVTGNLENRSGVYVILTPNGNTYKVLDVGESSRVRDRVENHDREDCWKRNVNPGGIYYAGYYTNEQQRMSIEKKIRDKYIISCGKK